VTEQEIVEFVTKLGGVDVMVASTENGAPEVAWGDTFFFCHPDPDVPADRRFPFATIVIKDYPDFDTSSNLDRPGVFRLNIDAGGSAFRRLFPGFGTDAYDATALDTPMPHPVYGPQHWVSILNPGPNAWPVAEELLRGALERATERDRKPRARKVWNK
jgi:hypothetical protein